MQIYIPPRHHEEIVQFVYTLWREVSWQTQWLVREAMLSEKAIITEIIRTWSSMIGKTGRNAHLLLLRELALLIWNPWKKSRVKRSHEN